MKFCKRFVGFLSAIIWVALVSCGAAAQTNGAWRLQAPLPTGEDLTGVAVVSAGEAWAVGTGGTIIHTADGGVTWAKQASGTIAKLDAVAFLDAQRGWAVGNTALYTIDGGATWHEGARNGNLSSLYQVAFADANNVFAPVSAGTGLLRSTDGGRNWFAQDTGFAVLRVTFFDPLNGIASGDGVAHTRDGGKTWQRQSGAAAADFYADFNTGWRIDNSNFVNGRIQQTINYTSDGGRTWSAGATPAGTFVSSLFFLDRLNGWGVGTQENVVRTSDGGRTWQTQKGGLDSAPVNKYLLNGARFADTLHGIAVGNGGNIFTTSDGGASWAPRQSGSQTQSFTITATDSDHAWTANAGGEVLYTADGGAHWNRAGLTAGTDVTDLKFTDSLNGWASLEGGSTSAVMRTTDGGRSWQQTGAPMAVMYTVDTVDNKTIIAAGWSGNFGVILRSADGGLTWSQITYPPSANIFYQANFISPTTGWLVGNRATILKTTDGGASWVKQETGLSSGTFQDVSFADANNGWVAGGGVLHTTDGGQTWTPQSLGLDASVWSVHAVSPTVAWVSGYNGLVARTTDGGQTWVRESVGTDATFQSCFFLDAENGWIAGGGSSVGGLLGEGRIFRRGAPAALPVNNPPAVSLTAPADGASYTAPASITISASASDADDGVTRVDFYAGKTLVGTATASPFTVTWGNVAAGSYVLSAVAVNGGGATAKSAPVNVTVNEAPAGQTLTSLTLNPTSVTGGATSQGAVALSGAAPAGGASVSLASSNAAVVAVPASVNVPAGGTGATFAATTGAVSAPTSVVISASYGGVTRTVVLNVTPAGTATTDTVGVQRAEYTGTKKALRVEAASTSAAATLKVYVTATDALIGTLTNNGGGRYAGQLTCATNPQNITVRSSAGGSATKAVSLK
jgi:photosystem II stability/assembly factor-like uncharacterized protein